MDNNTLIKLLQDALLLAGQSEKRQKLPIYQDRLSSFKRNANGAIIILKSPRVKVIHEPLKGHSGPSSNLTYLNGIIFR